MDLAVQPTLQPFPPDSDLILHSIEDSFSDSAHSPSVRNSSGADEAVFDSNAESHSTRESSAHISSGYSSRDEPADEYGCTNNDDDLISSLPSESRATSCALPPLQQDTLSYTPTKQRSPFRNPSFVRNLQLDLTPPHLRSPTSTSRRSQHSRTLNRHQHGRTTSGNGTPRSVRSHFSTRHSPPKPNPSPKREHPLVLLHVTLLPISSPYSTASLTALAPPHIIANWTLLREKVPDTVLERGILIPHPREDYELLEERLLESLELAVPRILKCGHFHLDPEEEAAAFAEEREADLDPIKTQDNGDEDGQYASEDETCDDRDLCADCGRHVRDGRNGSAGKGNKRWEIRIYAANGLMRAGAWSAAWREMERVDVEICPWMEDSVRRELEEARAVEEREEALTEMEAAGAVSEGSPCLMDEVRRREIYGGNDADDEDMSAESVKRPTLRARHGRKGEEAGTIPNRVESRNQSFTDDFGEEVRVGSDSARTQDQKTVRVGKSRPVNSEIPLQDLLLNYLRLLFRDKRNVALAILGFTVLLLSMRGGGTTALPEPAEFTFTPTSLSATGSSLFDSSSSTMTTDFVVTAPSVDNSFPFSPSTTDVGRVAKTMDGERLPKLSPAPIEHPLMG